HPAFTAGKLHTRFLEDHPIRTDGEEPIPDEGLMAAAWALQNNGRAADPSGANATSATPEAPSPWRNGSAWRIA
ncbi:MAG: 3-methylcrotonyl-CoA carboxylase, partial [Planctomycetota bacterium]